MHSSGYVSMDRLFDRFIGAFENNDNNIRYTQAKALWEGFEEYPLFGSGAGIGVDNFVRDTEYPWRYELSYNLILYNSGIVGFCIYGVAHIFLIALLYKKAKRKDPIASALLLSYSVVLVANATNPYFSSSFDFLWFIFIPLMYLNINTKVIKNKNV